MLMEIIIKVYQKMNAYILKHTNSTNLLAY